LGRKLLARKSKNGREAIMKKIRLSGVKRTIRSTTLVISCAMLCLGLLEAGATARADDSVGSVSQVTGTAQIQRGGASLPAQPGTPVQLHDVVSTQPGSTATLSFPDGSSIALTSGTTVTIEDAVAVNGQNVPSRVTLSSGNVHSIVPDKAGNPHHLEIDTQVGKAVGPSPNQ
jgi:hypothetical protein